MKHGMAEIIIAKHRNGAVGDVRLKFRGEFTRFMNADEDIAGGSQMVDGMEGPVTSSKMNSDVMPADDPFNGLTSANEPAPF